MEAKIVRVVAPATDNCSQLVAYGPDPRLYRYEVMPNQKGKLNMRIAVTAEKIIRPKSSLTKERLKLFMKQHVTTAKRLKITELKKASVEKFGLNRICWNDISSGPLPNFDVDLVPMPHKNPQEQRVDRRKQSFPNSCKQTKPGPKPLSPEEKSRRFEEAKQKRAEAKRARRAREKEERMEMMKQSMEWKKKRDDLECEDLKPLPVATPVELCIPGPLFGRAILILEFFNNFEEFFDLKEIFPQGFTVGLLPKLLCEKTIQSSIGDLVRIVLATIVCLQDEEDSMEKKEDLKPDQFNLENDGELDELDEKYGALSQAMKMSKQAVVSFKLLYGEKLSSLQMNAYTMTEILRQHFLLSGCPKPRSIFRGWFCSKEDPALHLRISNPELIEKLSTHTIFDLEVEERIIVLETLMSQVQTFPAFRELVDIAQEKITEFRKQMKVAHVDFGKWDKELNSRKMLAAQGDNAAKELFILAAEKEKKQSELKKSQEGLRDKIRKLEAQFSIRPLGRDRAFRRYWSFHSIPGLFVENDDPFAGSCLSLHDCPLYAKAMNDNCCVNLKRLAKSPSSSPTTSDKENRSHKSADHSSDSEGKLNIFDFCTGDIETCAIHGSSYNHEKVYWSFYENPEDLDRLIASLNSRGNRESELKQELEKHKEYIEEAISKCPKPKLNFNIPEEEVRKSNRLTYRPQANLTHSDKEPIQALALTLIEHMVTLDEQLAASGLASRTSHVAREEWKRNLVSVDVTQEDITVKLSQFLLKLGQSVQPQHMTKPLGGENPSFSRWADNLEESSPTLSQLFLMLSTLDSSIIWSKSALTAYCRICRKKKGAEHMLLCDSCNRGHHTYCLQPPLDSIPQGLWFCPECKPKSKSPRKESRKPRVDYTEIGEDGEPENDEDDPMDGNNSEFALETEEDTDVDTQDTESQDPEPDDCCAVCSAEDYEVKCSRCRRRYHMDCHNPPLLRTPRHTWICNSCVGGKRKESTETRTTPAAKKNKVFQNQNGTEKHESPKYSNGFHKEDSDFDSAKCSKIIRKLIRHESSGPFLKYPLPEDVSRFWVVVKT